MKAFHVDDETLYAATTAEEAARIYHDDTGEKCDSAEYPRELTDTELDQSQPEFDENEAPTGNTTTVRAMLAEQAEPGFLAGTIY